MSSSHATTAGFTLNPFHAVVRAKVIGLFGALSDADPGPALSLMADDVRYKFEGDHALGGTRTSRAGVERWFGRLFRLVPGRFLLRQVLVTGWPWNTRVVTVFDRDEPNADGTRTLTRGVQVAELEWGKAKRIQTFVDTGRLAQSLGLLALQGVAEASAEPITG